MTTQTLQLILTIGGVVSFMVIVAGGIGLLINAIKKKPRDEKNEVISSADQLAGFWKEQVEGFREVIKDLTAKLEKQKDDHTIEMKRVLTELGEVRGQLAEKNKQSEQYLAILQNRDPETQKFQEYIVKALENQSNTNVEIIRVLSEIHSMTKAEHERDFKVESVVTKQ